MLPVSTVGKGLRRGWLFLTAAGLGVEYAIHVHGHDTSFAHFFGLSYEANLPTWYSAVILWTCGLALMWIGSLVGQAGEPFRRHWSGLGLVFFYISLDESVQLHEVMSTWWPYGGVLYFSWVLPAGCMVAILGWIYLPFLRALPHRNRVRFVRSGIIYVTGALLLELPLGWWTEQFGSHNLVYGLIDLVEESMEIAGASLFLYALAQELSLRLGTESS